YIPAPSDTVIGQITARGPDFYTVSLLSSHTAALPVLAFEGATKRHRPNLRVGSLVYARVVSAERHTDPELSCVNPVNGKSDGLGELKVAEREVGCAMVFKISLGLASR
ncbi:exosome non-catalytic core subunit rrp40, partial [Tilletia horrida]